MDMTLYDLWQEGTKKLETAGDAEAAQDARLCLLEAFSLDMAHFLMKRTEQLCGEKEQGETVRCYRDMIERRSRHIPLAYIFGYRGFMGMEFDVTPDVLIPRQDTECLVELVLEEQKDRSKSVLDLCTGSGCIAISLAAKGGYQKVVGTDLSAEALKVAQRNAAKLLDDYGCGSRGKEKRCSFRQGDLFQALEDGEKYDVLVSNPPYIPTEIIGGLEPEVRIFEPRMALDGARDGLKFYRRIAEEAANWLKPGAGIYFEIGYDQGTAVSALLGEYGFTDIISAKDLAGKDRVVRARYRP